MKKVFFLSLMIFLLGCSNNINLKSDKVSVKIFDKKELIDIQNIIDFVDDIVKENTNQEEINKAYHLYFDTLKDSMFASNFIVPINRDKKLKFLESINEKTVEEFWLTDYSQNRFLILNRNGKFMEYLKNIAETDTVYYHFYDNFYAMGDITTSQLIIHFSNNNDIDFNEVKNRLLAAICLFTISEPVVKS